MEVQFRYKLYNDVKFPYLQSLGCRDILQPFGNEEVGFIGVLHLKWFNEDNNIVYDNPKEWPVTVKGIWKAYWYNTPEMGHKIAEEISFKLLATKNHPDHEWLKQKLRELVREEVNKFFIESEKTNKDVLD